MNFGDILKELLAINGISQKQLSADLNIGVSTIGNYVRGVREPSFDIVKLFAAYFNVSTDYLLNFSSDTAKDHSEDELLHIYRSLSPEQKELFLDQGKLLIRHAMKRNSTDKGHS